MSYRGWIIVTLVVVGLAVTLHAMRTAGRPRAQPSGLAPLPSRLRRTGLAAYLALLAGLGLTGLTGVASAGLGGVPMGGYALILHVGAGGLFAIALAALAVLWAERNTLDPRQQVFSHGQKITYWLMLALGLVMILTGIGPMFGIFGTETQRTLIALHKHVGLAVLGCAMFHIYLSVRYRSV